jgi:hypothetical protein
MIAFVARAETRRAMSSNSRMLCANVSYSRLATARMGAYLWPVMEPPQALNAIGRQSTWPQREANGSHRTDRGRLSQSGTDFRDSVADIAIGDGNFPDAVW